MKTACIVCAVALIAAGCGGTLKVGGEGDANGDTETDTGADAPADVPDDTPAETAPDVAPDTGEDPVEETEEDVVADSIEDPPGDTAADIPGDTGGGGLTGETCYDMVDCTGVPSDTRFCMDYMWGFIPFPGGYCTAWCGSDSDCGTGGGCAVGQCFKRCADDSECRTTEGYTCRTIPFVTTDTYCLPPMG